MERLKVEIPEHMVDTFIELIGKLEGKIIDIKTGKGEQKRELTQPDKNNPKSIEELMQELVALSETNSETIHLTKSETNRQRLQEAVDDVDKGKVIINPIVEF